MPVSLKKLARITAFVRYWIVRMTTEARSGHPTSSLSAVELMVSLMFGGTFRYNVKQPGHAYNDRLIFSKGHASPLFYALWAAAGVIQPSQLLTFRHIRSRLEGHPTMRFPYTELPTGSLGQGLSIGLGMALHSKYIQPNSSRVYVLLGDSEMAEGSVWEAIEIAAHYHLHNLIGVIDVNRLGQRGVTMHGHDLEAFERRIQAFGWRTLIVDGHSIPQLLSAWRRASRSTTRPVMIIAKTIKGKGVPLLENKHGWHGTALPPEQYQQFFEHTTEPSLDPVHISVPRRTVQVKKKAPQPYRFPRLGTAMAVREAIGHALAEIGSRMQGLVVLDAEVSNSTKTDIFKQAFPRRFFEMYIAEQNMVGAALGLARSGMRPVVSTFAAFLMRAADQIRMSQYAHIPIVYIGSHAGSSIGKDGASQMGLEDIALFRSARTAVVVCPSDAYSARALLKTALRQPGIVYIRSTRAETPVIYTSHDTFRIGGSRVLHRSTHDRATIISIGITLHAAVEASATLNTRGINVRVIDAYSIKPLDTRTIRRAARETRHIIVVEDHYSDGGLGDAVLQALAGMSVHIDHLCVDREPRSGEPDAVLEYEGIGKRAMIQAVTRRHH